MGTPAPRCRICGSSRTADDKHPSLCYYLCFWILEGWLGWNARTKHVAIKDQRAFRFVPTSKTDPYCQDFLSQDDRDGSRHGVGGGQGSGHLSGYGEGSTGRSLKNSS